MKQLPFLLFLVCTVGCSAADLTRSKAEQIIDAQLASNPGPTQIPAKLDQIKVLFSQNLATPMVIGNVTYANPTPEGRKYFSDILINTNEGTYFLVMIQPISKKVLAITGITDAVGSNSSSIKQVNYDWVYDMTKAPDPLRPIFSSSQIPQHASAFVQHFDDGWRFAGTYP